MNAKEAPTVISNDTQGQEIKVPGIVEINTKFSSHVLPIIATPTVINTIQNALSELEKLKQAIDIIRKHGSIKFSNGNLQNDFPVFEKAKNVILKGEPK